MQKISKFDEASNMDSDLLQLILMENQCINNNLATKYNMLLSFAQISDLFSYTEDSMFRYFWYRTNERKDSLPRLNDCSVSTTQAWEPLLA